MQFPLLSLPVLFIGLIGMVFSATFDFFKVGMPNFGMVQLAGFAVSAITALAGLRKIHLLRASIWDGLLLLVYLSGILFLGLRYQNEALYRPGGMLQNFGISFSDVTINIVGFVPLGCLMMSS